MKLNQSVRHFAVKRALTMPVVGPRAVDWLVDLHVRVFSGRADPDHRDERMDHLEAFFTDSTAAYVAALEAGHPEAEAREIVHVMANLDFAAHGWTEMLEFPLDEVDAHLERYAAFFGAHGVTPESPLGDFASGPLPEAPTTPDRLETGETPNAVGGYADAAYVERADGEVQRGGLDEPEDLDPSAVLQFDDA